MSHAMSVARFLGRTLLATSIAIIALVAFMLHAERAGGPRELSSRGPEHASSVDAELGSRAAAEPRTEVPAVGPGTLPPRGALSAPSRLPRAQPRRDERRVPGPARAPASATNNPDSGRPTILFDPGL